MLVHICCSVDSHFFLQELQKRSPDEKLVGFFYDPNIHPYSEYQLRLLDVKRSCQTLGIELIEGEYDYETWYRMVKGLEDAPEKGERCRVCFDKRLEVSAKMAKKLGEKSYTTSLLVSPLKSQTQLQQSAQALQEYAQFLFIDFRKFGGSSYQTKVAKEEKLYRQDYCGCFYALNKQRQKQQTLSDELFSDIHNRLLPASIEERLALYEKRLEYEEMHQAYRIEKERFLNYRLLQASLRINKEIVLSYIFSYSTTRRSFNKAVIEHEDRGIFYANKEEIKIFDIKSFNTYAKRSYANTKALLEHPLSIDEEIAFRHQHFGTFNLAPLIVVDEIALHDRLELRIEAKSYEDVREVLVKIG